MIVYEDFSTVRKFHWRILFKSRVTIQMVPINNAVSRCICWCWCLVDLGRYLFRYTYYLQTIKSITVALLSPDRIHFTCTIPMTCTFFVSLLSCTMYPVFISSKKDFDIGTHIFTTCSIGVTV